MEVTTHAGCYSSVLLTMSWLLLDSPAVRSDVQSREPLYVCGGDGAVIAIYRPQTWVGGQE
jgi:hypothetical protein